MRGFPPCPESESDEMSLWERSRGRRVGLKEGVQIGEVAVEKIALQAHQRLEYDLWETATKFVPLHRSCRALQNVL